MIPTIKNIVVGSELRPSADAVVRAAVELAGHLGATLHVVHGYLLTDPLLDAYARAGYLGEQTLIGYGQDLQAALEAQAARVAGDVAVRAIAVAGSPATAMLQVAAETAADLIVVGNPRHERLPLSLLGSSCRTVVRRSEVPVLMVRPGISPVPKRVLAPTDLSALSAAAYEWGFAIAGLQPRRVEMRSLLVISESLMLLPLEQSLLEKVAEQQLTAFAKGVAIAATTPEIAIRKGDPASEIVAEATEWGADLVVLGTHGRRGMDRFLLGSVAEAALKAAQCNVLIVPPSPEQNLREAASD